jgi:hypothetical protein
MMHFLIEYWALLQQAFDLGTICVARSRSCFWYVDAKRLQQNNQSINQSINQSTHTHTHTHTHTQSLSLVASLFLQLTKYLVFDWFTTIVLASQPVWQRPTTASTIRWNGCASNDETYAILSIGDGSTPSSSFRLSAASNTNKYAWQILPCDVTVPGQLVMQFPRESMYLYDSVTITSITLTLTLPG